MCLPCFYDQFLLLCFTFPLFFFFWKKLHFFCTVLYIILIFEGLSLQRYSCGDLRSSFIHLTHWDRPCLARRNVLQKNTLCERANIFRMFQFIHLGLVLLNLYFLQCCILLWLSHLELFRAPIAFTCICFYRLKLCLMWWVPKKANNVILYMLWPRL